MKLQKALVLLGVGLLGYAGGRLLTMHKNDPRSASVMIVNRGMTHGGTGIIVHSTSSQSTVLTNDHVCKAIKTGGVVRAATGDYQVTSIIESELSDLCFVQVPDDLGIETTVSTKAPKKYDTAMVSGHPALMPNVLSTGHFSGRDIIQVMTGMRPCSDTEKADPNTGLACLFFGGLPVVKSYESVLVTATIMPGSSGSGVYNSSNELSGVVFAGSSSFGYAWTVPYEQVVNFVTKEHAHLKVQNISQEINIMGASDDSKKLKDAQDKCNNVNNNELLSTPEKKEVINNLCDIIKSDMTWVK